jgi:uncharacterized protein YndB with AHSA1/START domain
MTQQLLVRDSITINASATSVWNVLVRPQYIRQWDELPEDFGEAELILGSEILWQLEGGGYTKLTVTKFDKHRQLRLSLYNSSWERPTTAYDIAYTYTLANQAGTIQLSLAIGDFASLPNGQDYYEASVEFAAHSLKKIKELSEA